MTQQLCSGYISSFSQEICDFCYIWKYRKKVEI